MIHLKKSLAALTLASTLAITIHHGACAAETKASWQTEWDNTVKAAEQEGQVALYSLSEIGDAIANTGFQKDQDFRRRRAWRRACVSRDGRA